MQKSNQQRHKRGFILFVVLGVAVMLSAMTFAYLSRSGTLRVAASRVSHQALARAVAEQCIQRAVRFAREEANDPAVEDLDRLLDPNPGTSGDDFIPDSGSVGGTVVYVPSSAASGSAAVQAAHRFLLLPEGSGACLIRYDDNNDDFLASAAGLSTREYPGGSPVTEGPAAGGDVANRDRDRAIIVTVIGIHPYRTGSDATAYETARSRVTKRGFLQTEITSTTTTRALELTGNLHLSGTSGGPNRFRVCGPAGSYVGGNVTGATDHHQCFCGDTYQGGGHSIHDCGGSCGGVGCPSQNDLSSATAPPVDGTTGRFQIAAADGPPGLPSLGIASTLSLSTAAMNTLPAVTMTSIMSINNFGGNMGTAGASPNACEYYLQETPPAALGGAFAAIPAPTIYVWDHGDTDPDSNLPSHGRALSFVDGAGAATAIPAPWSAHNCANYSFANVGAPCRWDASSGTVQCNANETLCWKPVAVLDNAGTGWLTATGDVESTNSTHPGGSETFQPQDAARVPFADSDQTWSGLCGPRSPGDNHRGWRHNGTDFRFSYSGDPVSGDQWSASGSYFIIDSAGTTAARDSLGNNASPMRAAFFTQGNLRFDEAANACCPTCDCTANGGVFNFNNGDCTWDKLAAAVNGPIVMAGGTCAFQAATIANDDHDVVGHFLCGNMTVDNSDNDNCFLGNILASNSTGNCSGINDCDNPGVCLHRNVNVAGSVISGGDVCLDDDVRIDAGYGSGIVPSGIIYAYGEMDAFDDSSMAAPVYINVHAHFFEDVQLDGRLVTHSLQASEHGSHINYSGGTTPTLSVLEETQWLETSW